MRFHRVLGAVLGCLLIVVPAAAAAGRCDGVPRRGCLLPFPNDVGQTRPDRTSATGVRVALRRADMPANSKGVHVATRELNRNDGFSPGQPIIVHVPSLRTQADFRASGLVPIDDMARYRRPAQRLLLLDERTARRQLVWAELDANATTEASRNLIIHPGRNLVPGRRYVVVLRNLRDRQPRGLRATWTRGVRSALRRARVRPRVFLAWRFTVASNRSLTGRLLAMRDDAFRQLGDRNLADRRIQGSPPRFAVTGVTDFTAAENALTARRVTGTFQVPCYMANAGCGPGGRLHYSSTRPDATPTQLRGNVQTATFTCNLPREAPGTPPAHIALYGHGLLGDQSEVNADPVQAMGAEHDFAFCATNWYGFSGEDIPTAIAALGDLSKFPAFIDRQLQGMIAQLYLGRLLAHPRGLVTDPAFAGRIDVRGPLSWDSNSQGAIMGGALTAIAPDWRRAVLGVAGMDYGVLLQRSTDFATYRAVLDPAYPDAGQQSLLLSIVQMLWDRSETNGWTQYATRRPPPNTPSHTLLLHVAVGDHQVANVQADTEARSIGASIYRPSVAPGRTRDRRPSYGIPAIGSFPFRGSAVVWWDGGPCDAAAALTNTPATVGADPHSFPRKTVAARTQKSTFLLGGGVVDVCGGRPCRTDNFG